MNKKNIKGIYILVFFLGIFLIPFTFSIKKVENTINTYITNANPRTDSIDSISLGETRNFDVYNPGDELCFNVEYVYVDKTINTDSTITYELNYSLTNLIDTQPTTKLFINIYEIQSDGSAVKNATLSEETDFSLEVNDVFNDTITFTLDEEIDVAVSTSVLYNASPYESGLVYLFSKDRPIIENNLISEDLSNNKYEASYNYSGDLELVDSIEFYNNETLLVEGTDYQVLTEEEAFNLPTSIEFLNLNSNTIYSEFNLKIYYHTNFPNDNRIDTYNLGSFGTLPNNINDLFSISLESLTSYTANIYAESNLSGITTLTLNKIEILNQDEIIETYDVEVSNANNSGILPVDNLTPNTNYDLDVKATYETYSGSEFSISYDLDNFTTTPLDIEVTNFSTSNITSDSVELNWEISDPSSVITNIQISDKDSLNVIYEGDEKSVSNFEVNNLMSNTAYSYEMTITSTDINGNDLTPLTQTLTFNTSIIEPTLEEYSIETIDQNSIKLSWKFLDENSYINKVEILDSESTTIYSDVDATDGFDNDELIINELDSNSIYNYTFNYYWSYTNSSEEIIEDNETINFTSYTDAFAPEISLFKVSERGEDFLTISWDVSDDDSTLNEIEFTNTNDNVSYSTSDLTGTYTFTGLEDSSTYNIEMGVYWNSNNPNQVSDTLFQDISVDTIWKEPIIDEIIVEESDDDFTISWEIGTNNDDLTIDSISIEINGELRELEIDVNGEITIPKDEFFTGDNSIKVIVDYHENDNPDEIKVVEKEINYLNSNDSFSYWWWTLLAIIILILIMILVLVIIKNKNSKIKTERIEEAK